MRGLPQKQNARRADKIKLCGHLRRYKKIVKKTYIISDEQFAAAAEACLYVCSQSAGSITIAANGTVPECDIPVTVILLS